MAKRPTPSSKRAKPAPKRATKPKPKLARASKPTPAKPARKAPAKPTGPSPHHIAAISAAVLTLLGPLAIVRSITPGQSKPNRWVPHLQRPLLRSEHEPRRRTTLTRHPPR